MSVFAEKAATLTKRKEPRFVDTLAAANAQAGRFTNAVRIQQEAVALVQNEQEKSGYV
jgi:Flp pilus assembly protein TadD